MNNLGLPKTETSALAEELNNLLSNFQIYYQNLRGLHWNIRGKRFFDLHLKFEELYNDAQIKIDLIAERVLTLGKTPLHTFSDYLAHNSLVIGKNISKDEEAIELILNALTTLLVIERTILKNASAIDDEGTNALMSGFIQEQEKTIWMLKAWLAETI